MTLPGALDEAVTWAVENPGIPRKIDHTIVFELPEGWTDRVDKELSKLGKVIP